MHLSSGSPDVVEAQRIEGVARGLLRGLGHLSYVVRLRVAH
ncbi:hypothetical protein ACFRAI_27710 [Streptomyces sp. NPDC056637]